jgi:hypothetical protein
VPSSSASGSCTGAKRLFGLSGTAVKRTLDGLSLGPRVRQGG